MNELFLTCLFYTNKKIFTHQENNEEIYALCIEYLIQDSPKLSTIEKLKAFFNLN